MASLHAPLPTLRRPPRGGRRTAWGQCGSLPLHCRGLPPPTPCRSPGALPSAITTVLAGLVALQWGFNPLVIMAVNGLFLIIDLIFVAANATKLVEGGWFPLLLAAVVAFFMLTWRTGWRLLEDQRSRLRQREDEFTAWVLRSPPLRLP